jgi:serine phosphatase RsbU (regulator of sigma subunit)
MTGWGLRCAPESNAEGDVLWSKPIGCLDTEVELSLIIDPPQSDLKSRSSSTNGPLCDQQQVQAFAEVFGDLLRELSQTRHALWQREAELAAGVPVASHADEQMHLASRLEAILKAGAKAVDCQAAAAYLLDDSTRSLKLRTCWGLPKNRFLEAPRQLRGAAADLEALVGHAVVLEDTRLLPHWRVPEEFRSAVCVPISSPTVPLGTLWMFCDRARGFSEDESNMIEIVAGRMAAELEREMLLQESVLSRKLNRQAEHATHWQQSRLPRIKPLLPKWQVAAWTKQGDTLGGDFHDWFVLPDGSLAVTVGDAEGKMFEAALTAASVQTALKSHAWYRHTAQEMVERVNETLWAASCGDQFASMFYAMIQPESGQFEHVAAGHMHAAVIGDTFRPLASGAIEPLGTQPDSHYIGVFDELAAGEILVVISEGAQRELKVDRNPALWKFIDAHRQCDADTLIGKACSFLEQFTGDRSSDDQTILIVKRTSA